MAYQMQSVPAARAVVNGRERDYFSGCGYLGLAGHPVLLQAAIDTIQRYGLTSETSRGGYGENPVYEAVEAAACRFFHAERVTYYPSGYLGAAILGQGLQNDFDQIWIDESAHFSVRDGARSAGKPVHAFAHRDADSLSRSLAQHLLPGQRPLLLSDGVFPISGELAPVPDYLAVLQAYPGGILALDDAHATGALGPEGRGTLNHYGLEDPSRTSGVRCIAAHTLSKALGGYGGMIAGSTELVHALETYCKVADGTSPPPLPLAAASGAALDLARSEPERRERLWANVAHARQGLRGLGWPLDDSPVPVICLGAYPGMGQAVDLARLQADLFERDICVAHVKNYSSTPLGGALRVAIFATHSEAQIDRLIDELGNLL